MAKETKGAPIRELFIDELEEVKGGSTSPWKKLEELLVTTYGQCEETPVC
ncbi:MAG TPA: hypothetical protein VJ927_11980 [Actinomycetota bacterium]|nr:hypothetical protein [Actinomycetota bacterium]